MVLALGSTGARIVIAVKPAVLSPSLKNRFALTMGIRDCIPSLQQCVLVVCNCDREGAQPTYF